MKIRSQDAIFAAMLGACLFACDSNQGAGPGAGPNPEGKDAGSDFDRSVLTIKAMKATQEEKLSAIDALVSRYGHGVAAPRPAEPVAADEGDPGSGPLRKSASVTRYYARKGHNFGNTFVLHTVTAVTPSKGFTAWTTRPAGSTADPFLVAYYQSAGELGDKGAFPMFVAGLNDDDGQGLDSRINWQNQTGSTKWVHCYAFAYSSATGGTATLVSQMTGFAAQVVTGDMRGLVEYDDNMSAAPASGCTGPKSDRLTLRKVANGGDTYAVMLVNAASMRGGVIFSDKAVASQTLNLTGSATPSGYPNFMLWFAQGSGATEGNYAGLQYHGYTCPD